MEFELQLAGMNYRVVCAGGAVRLTRLCSGCKSSLEGDNIEYTEDKDGIEVMECQTCRATELWDAEQANFHERWEDGARLALERALIMNPNLDWELAREIVQNSSPRERDKKWD